MIFVRRFNIARWDEANQAQPVALPARFNQCLWFRSQRCSSCALQQCGDGPTRGQVGPSPPRWFVIGGAGEGRDHLGYACSAQTNCGKFGLGPRFFQV